MTRLDPTNPEAAFRFHLLMSLAPHAGASDPVDLAARAFDFIYGQRQAAHQEEPHDQHTETPPPPADAGGDAQGGRGGQSDKGSHPQPEPDGGSDVGGADGEPGDPTPAQGDEPESEPPAELSSAPVPPRVILWTEDRKAELKRLCAEGLEEKEIADRMGLPQKKNAVYANAYRFGFCPMWKGARERRRTQQVSAEPKIGHINPSADIEEPKPLVVELSRPEVSPQPSADDLAAVALVADKHPLAARDVQPGKSWAFDHRTLAEVAEPSRPEVAPLPPKEERDRLIAEHIAIKGVTTAEPDFGPDQAAVDVLRSVFHSVVRSNRPAAPWLINGAPVTTPILWKRANAELKQHGKKPIKRKD